MIWHDEAARFFETGQLDPVDKCMCPDCVEAREAE